MASPDTIVVPSSVELLVIRGIFDDRMLSLSTTRN